MWIVTEIPERPFFYKRAVSLTALSGQVRFRTEIKTIVDQSVMKSYLLKLSGREEGPCSESQVAKMFADQRVDRYMPCKPEAAGDWKTIDNCKGKKFLFETPESLSFKKCVVNKKCAAILTALSGQD